MLVSCSTKKKSVFNRAYHNVTSKYNGYWNGREAQREAIKTLNKNNKDNFEEVLRVYPIGTKEDRRSVYPQMDKAIDKAGVVIQKHSMLIKGKEYCNWIDDSYLLIGKSNFYKGDYLAGLEIFTYMQKQYQDKKSRFDAALWSIRTNTELLRYKTGEEEILKLEADKTFPKKKKGAEFATVTADFFLAQADYNQAIPKLEQAIALSKKGRMKTRMTYILGQLYQEKNDGTKAAEMYTKVIKRNAPYEMEFNARINRALMASEESGQLADIKKELKKMARDDKNVDFLDRIYFALADIAMDEQDKPLALDYLQKSIRANTTNPTQKAISYYTVGDIYFDDREYPKAAAYYDSSYSVLPPEHKQYERVKAKRDNLADLVKNLKVIAYQDSMLMLSELSDSELDALIADLIADVVAEEERLAQVAENFGANSPQDQSSNRSNNTGSTWYFYNQTSISYGLQEFREKWGERKLEDNWRRSNKQTVLSSGDEDGVLPTDSASLSALKDPANYLKNVPRTAGAIDSAHITLEGALYNLGVIYKDKIGDKERSVEAFEDYLERYPNGRYKLETFYQLHLLGKAIGNIELAEGYKQKIISQYPESDYAKILTDPTYLAKLEALKGELGRMYARAYQNYLDGEYEKTFAGCDSALIAFEKEDLIPKFGLLRAMTIGKTDRLIAYRRALENVVETYPGTPEKTRAEELLGYVKGLMGDVQPSEKEEGRTENAERGKGEEDLSGGSKKGGKEKGEKEKEKVEESTGEQPEESNETEPEAPEIYTFNFDTSHYYLLVISKVGLDINKIKAALSNFNTEFYSIERLKIKTAKLGRDNDMFYVTGFKQTAKCMDYYENLKSKPELFEGLEPSELNQFIISNQNFTTFFRDKNVETYNAFFSANYLKGD